MISIYHLAAVLSGGAEVDYELGLRVNVDGTRAIIRRCQELGNCPRFILTSSVAVFGPPEVSNRRTKQSRVTIHLMTWLRLSSWQECGQVVSESSAPRPESSYGTQVGRRGGRQSWVVC